MAQRLADHFHVDVAEQGERRGSVPEVVEAPAGTARDGIANAVEVSVGSGSHAQQVVRAARRFSVDGRQ